MNKRFLSSLLLIAAMVLGLASGYVNIPFLNGTADVVSVIFLRILKLISLPMIFFAITSTLSGMKNFSEVKRIGRRILSYTLFTTIIAAAVALGLYLLINPASLAPKAAMAEVVAPTQPTYLSFLMNIIPDNIVNVFSESNVVGIVFIAIGMGIGSLLLPSNQKQTLNSFFSSVFSLMLKLTGGIIRLMPIAIWAFMALLVQELRINYENFNTLWLYLLCVVGANVIQGVIVLPLLLKYKKISPLKAIKAMSPALSMAFFSKSSNATLPLSMASIENRAGVSKKVSNFSLPLCSVINMNGCAAFILISTLFVATLSGHVFTPFDYIAWIFIATLAAVGNAGVPMGCYFLTSAFLVGMDVPLYMMGLILPFYTIIDMIETALNVWSDSCVTMVVDKELGESKEIPATPELATLDRT